MYVNFHLYQNIENDQRVGRDLHRSVLRADPGRGHLGGAQEAARQ